VICPAAIVLVALADFFVRELAVRVLDSIETGAMSPRILRFAVSVSSGYAYSAQPWLGGGEPSLAVRAIGARPLHPRPERWQRQVEISALDPIEPFEAAFAAAAHSSAYFHLH
jgi:hypothetical protein